MSSVKKKVVKKADTKEAPTKEAVVVQKREPEYKYWLGMLIAIAFAIYTRFTLISHPNKVVFDEVHFGKFASYYLERTYFFDLHPPFAKLLIAFMGWLVGYDGKFKFENINDDYITNNVPYVAYRVLSAIQGVVTIPVMFQTMKTLGYSVDASLFSSLIVCFDNAHIIDSRLILLDATLNLSVALTMFCYAKFSTYRLKPFTSKWWIWLTLTGVSLSCVISTKYVGVLTYVTIGIAVLHELWFWLDYKKGLTLYDFSKHFMARFFSLIIFPFIIYLFWFYVHFSVLNKSGPGDTFMSAEFQDSLVESPLARDSKIVNYFDIITIKHKETEAFLHSHLDKYPLRYEDGRISSNTQQVTAIKGNETEIYDDVNSQWEIIPIKSEYTNEMAIFTNDIIRLRHVGTKGYLLSHDVASPLKSTNEEFTITYDEELYSKAFNESLFRIRYAAPGASNQNKRKAVTTKQIPLRIIHVDTVVSMWTHDDELLPEWGHGHQEVSGNKKIKESSNVWYFDKIINLSETDPRNKYVPKQVKPMPFLKKWWELQFLMFHHNNKLTSSHPFASQPDAWPLALSGVSFWNDNVNKRQIYFTGNVVGFWLEVCFLAVFCGLILADQISRRRNVLLMNDKARSRLYNTLGFFFIGWCAHYFPFFLMGRQKFLHHYLPAHLIAALFSGGLLEFVCTNNRIDGVPGIDRKKLTFLTTVFTLGLVAFFFWFKPISYGDVPLAPSEVRQRQILDMKLHYAK
ncbi:dolichyl-phosphate-mannose--protein mannosyltransferase 4 [[Candida] jaroonii]|uniref:Dolichyl-phosphate-mannose--protein mannosyltransferase 4 n=1 Tax=[Candida] jaroonii TaxID=467808 RepID=A0ACA9Y0D0_9ASCO|nr:dolichyl-phosphate-mannose--protein mannosyltransferase 4 [[Candida] jaroonii]